ncbi:MAG TPA: hypothetical protein VIP09_07450 [Dehalococcoidia bacterium]|jgi:hypothetical protein
MQEPVVEDWERYGRAVIESMREVLAESPEEMHGLLLETADYWLSLGLAIGLRQPGDAELLLKLIQQGGEDSGELDSDGAALCTEVFG